MDLTWLLGLRGLLGLLGVSLLSAWSASADVCFAATICFVKGLVVFIVRSLVVMQQDPSSRARAAEAWAPSLSLMVANVLW